MKLVRVAYADVARFKSAAARDGVSISDTNSTEWWMYGDVGIIGNIATPTGARIKGVWVKPEHRGKGHGTAMTLALIDLLTSERLLCRLEALAGKPEFYEGLGWRRIAPPRANGAVLVARNF